MKRAVTTALALLMIANLFTAYAIVPVIIAGAVLIGSGIGIGLWLGHNIWGKPADQKIHELEQQLTNETIENLATLETASENAWGKSKIIVYNLGDAVHYGRNYAWALAKYTILKALQQGDTLDAAASKARYAVYKYYLNVTKNIIEEANNTAKYLNFTLNEYAKEYGDNSPADKLVAEFTLTAWSSNYWVRVYPGHKVTLKIWNRWSDDYSYCPFNWKSVPFKLGTTTIKALGKSFKVVVLTANVSYCGDGRAIYRAIGFSNGQSRTVVYDFSVYRQVLNQINSEYNNIINNINKYVQGLKNAHNFNVSDLIDPYVLATFLDKDWNKTGYYGYAAAELALLGLNTTGLNETVTIDYHGHRLGGFLFTDWTGKLEVNHTYQADNNHVWYLVTTDGQGHTLLVPLSGQFRVVSLEDWQGHKLNSTTLTNYDPHSGDVQKIYKELEKIETLYEQYLKNLQPASGGGGFSADLANWWNSLDETAKLGVIAVGCVAVYAIFRRR